MAQCRCSQIDRDDTHNFEAFEVYYSFIFRLSDDDGMPTARVSPSVSSLILDRSTKNDAFAHTRVRRYQAPTNSIKLKGFSIYDIGLHFGISRQSCFVCRGKSSAIVRIGLKWISYVTILISTRELTWDWEWICINAVKWADARATAICRCCCVSLREGPSAAI